MIELKENVLNKELYLSLRKAVGWVELSDYQACKAVDNCLFNIVAYIDEVPAGMGRIVGDGAVICYVQDLVILPEYQGHGVGRAILNRLTEYVDSIRQENTTMMYCLMCAKGREEFYEKLGFTQRPNEKLGPGMIMYLKDNI